VADHLQVSKGVLPKAKLKLKQLKAIGQHISAQTITTLMNVPSSEDGDDYTIMGTIVEPMHEHNVSKLDTYAHGENWHTQKHQHLVHLALQGEQNVQDKVPPTYYTIEIIAFSLPGKRPRTIPSP
jgi:hypothetical protein